ncbi:MAG TPA: dienelactone hydrolase family protein [Fibrobacteria bacterium]|nr:dienelactone hydrolase family protein [Fibrobacteria bacterium]
MRERPSHCSLTAVFTVLLCAAAAGAAVKSEAVAYKQDTASLEGLLVYDAAAKGKQPGIVLVPDWMGMTDLARQYAEKVAKLGYVVLVADIYGAKVRPKDMKEASEQSALYKNNRELMQARARAAYDQLRKSPRVDTARLAAMGYCFGGGVALELARSGATLNGTVTFHGNLDTPHPQEAKNIKGQVLVNHGAEDPFVTVEQVKSFEDEMRLGGVDWRLIQYGGAVHGFTNPNAGNDNSKGMAYNAKADHRSWQAMTDFYKEIFGKPTFK